MNSQHTSMRGNTRRHYRRAVMLPRMRKKTQSTRRESVVRPKESVVETQGESGFVARSKPPSPGRLQAVSAIASSGLLWSTAWSLRKTPSTASPLLALWHRNFVNWPSALYSTHSARFPTNYRLKSSPSPPVRLCRFTQASCLGLPQTRQRPRSYLLSPSRFQFLVVYHH